METTCNNSCNNRFIMISKMAAVTAILKFSKRHFLPRARIKGVGVGCPDPPPPLKSQENIGFRSNSGPDPLKNHKAVKPAFNGPPPARQRAYSSIWILPSLIN